MPSTNPNALVELLCSLFASAEALQVFLRERQDGRVVVQSLPSPTVSLRQFVGDAVELLERRGDLGLTFFSALAVYFPGRARDISLVANGHGLAFRTPTGGTRAAHAFAELFDDASLGSSFDLDR